MWENADRICAEIVFDLHDASHFYPSNITSKTWPNPERTIDTTVDKMLEERFIFKINKLLLNVLVKTTKIAWFMQNLFVIFF